MCDYRTDEVASRQGCAQSSIYASGGRPPVSCLGLVRDALNACNLVRLWNVFCSWCEPQRNGVVYALSAYLKHGGQVIDCNIVRLLLSLHPRRHTGLTFTIGYILLFSSVAMLCKIPFSLVALVHFAALQIAALPSFSRDAFGLRSSLSSLVSRTQASRSGIVEKRQDGSNFETETNGSQFLWLIQDTYEGQSFFELSVSKTFTVLKILMNVGYVVGGLSLVKEIPRMGPSISPMRRLHLILVLHMSQTTIPWS